MKDILVLCAVLPFTLAIIFFIGSLEKNSDNENFVREAVYYYVQQASRDGYFTAYNLEEMKESIADVLKVESEEIKVTVDTTIKYRPESISYKVEAPIKKIVPANKLFGISDENNKGKIVIENKVMSERLAP